MEENSFVLPFLLPRIVVDVGDRYVRLSPSYSVTVFNLTLYHVCNLYVRELMSLFWDLCTYSSNIYILSSSFADVYHTEFPDSFQNNTPETHIHTVVYSTLHKIHDCYICFHVTLILLSFHVFVTYIFCQSWSVSVVAFLYNFYLEQAFIVLQERNKQSNGEKSTNLRGVFV